MNPYRIGVLWCLCFIVLEAVQAVYFGGVLQRMDSFLLGFLVFGITTIGAITWTALAAPQSLRVAWRNPGPLIGANIAAALSWIAYLLSVQMIEPAVTYTIFCGAVPLTTLLAHRLGVRQADGVRGAAEAVAYLIVFAGLAFLAVATVLGWSGFVRGGIGNALIGVGLAIASGFIITWMLFFCRTLDRAGVGPIAQFGLRFVLYVGLAGGGALVGFDHKGDVPAADLTVAVLVGLGLMAFPLYAVQKAITLVSPLTIGGVGALGPLMVFLFQFFEGRVDYAPATLLGLSVYFVGALLAAYGAARAGDSQSAKACAACE